MPTRSPPSEAVCRKNGARARFVGLVVIGHATDIITGLAVSLQTTVLPVTVISASMWIAYSVGGGLCGVALACVRARRRFDAAIVHAAISAFIAAIRLPDDWRARVLAVAARDDTAMHQQERRTALARMRGGAAGRYGALRGPEACQVGLSQPEV